MGSKTQQSFRLPPASRRCNKAHIHVTCAYIHACMLAYPRARLCVCVAMQRYSKCKAGACAQKGDSNRSCDWYWDNDCDCDCDSVEHTIQFPLPFPKVHAKAAPKARPGALLSGGCFSSSFAAEIARKKYDHEIESNSSTKAAAAAAVAALCCVAFSGEQANENEMTNEANFKRTRRWWREPRSTAKRCTMSVW